MKFRFLTLALLFCLLSACATTIQLMPTDRVPAAQGEMTLSKDDNENTAIDLEVRHLAPPDKLRGDLTVYVVWTRPAASEEWKNLGQLKVNDELTGSATFSVPHAEFDVQVSAEPNGEVSTPSEFVVFEAQAKK